MRVLIISASPNTDGLTAACANAAIEGVRAAGGTAVELRLNDLKLAACKACDHGWGTCQPDHQCQIIDDFQPAHKQAIAADALIIVTPVYWGDLSESAKSFMDRLRRCEATLKEESRLADKPVIAVAAAGGSGNGMITCLASMERWIEHVRARKWDLLPVNRWSRDYKLETIRAAAAAMVHESEAEPV